MNAVWKMQDAKARLSEVVRLALNDRPQDISVRGEPAVTVVATSKYERLKRERSTRTGLELINALRCDALDDIVLERISMPAGLTDASSFDD
jgi:antitoxin Phd